MKQSFLVRKGHSRLLLFFAGWGMDETPFRTLMPVGWDLLICYDYRSLAFDESVLKGYTSVALVAWSMGVWAASQCFGQADEGRFAVRMAINGTPRPVDDEQGIPLALFEGTIHSLSEASLAKFYRRMCGSADAYRQFICCLPQRGIEELKEELCAIQMQAAARPISTLRWTKVVIGRGDRIFPPTNQVCAWREQQDCCVVVEAAHGISNQQLSTLLTYSE